MQHIGQDWPRKRMLFVLEASMMKDRMIRDAWLNWTTESAMLCRQPLAKNIPNSRAFQRKVAVWRYNQIGMFDREMWNVPTVCKISGGAEVMGTRGWVPYLNISSWTASYHTRDGMLMAYRVAPRGFGEDPTLIRGQWARRYNKTWERNSGHLTRA